MNNKEENRKRLKEITDILSKQELLKGFTPEKLVNIIVELGPTFIKFGQIMSMRTDLLPEEYCIALSSLRSDVEHLEFNVVKNLIEQEFAEELESVFSSFDKEPIGAASMGQVHLAKIEDQQVVVKVQRPNIYEMMSVDIVLLKKAAKIIGKTHFVDSNINFNDVLDEMWSIAKEELDFKVEMSHFKTFYELNKDVPYATCPKVFEEYTTSKVLVMEYAGGCAIDDIQKLTEQDYNLEEIAEKLCHNYAKQILDNGFFHADPHAGNIKIDNGKIVWLDLGMVGQLSDQDKELLASIMQGINDNNVNQLSDTFLSLGVVKGEIDRVKLNNDIDIMLRKYVSASMTGIDIKVLNDDLINIFKSNNLGVPARFSMLGRGMVTLSGVLLKLSKNLSFADVIKSYLKERFRKNFNIRKTIKKSVKSGFYSAKKLVDLPSQLSNSLEMFSKGMSKMKMELSMSKSTKKDLNSMIDRLTVGIVIAALLIASSLICTTNMSIKLMGIPALGFIGYVIAIILAAWLVLSVSKK